MTKCGIQDKVEPEDLINVVKWGLSEPKQKKERNDYQCMEIAFWQSEKKFNQSYQASPR